jgi:hypothetical protein
MWLNRLPNVVTLLTFVSEVPGVKLGRGTDNSALSFPQFIHRSAEILPYNMSQNSVIISPCQLNCHKQSSYLIQY